MVCAGVSVDLSTFLSGADIGGTWSPAGPNIIASSTQAYTYSVSNGCGGDEAVITVSVTPGESAGGDWIGTVCEGTIVDLDTLLSGNSTTGSWSNGNVVTITASYTYTYTVSGACGTDEATFTFSALPVPDAAFSYGPLTFCANESDPLPSVATTGGTFSADPSTLAIDPSTGSVDLGASPLGTYTVTYAIGGTCPAEGTASFTITGPADATWHVPGDGTLCATSDPILLDTLIDGNGGGAWSGDGVSGNIFDPSTTSGVAHITYSVGSGACTSSLQLVIVITPAPIAFAGNDAEYCELSAHLAATAGIGVTGSWSGGPGSSWSDPFDPGATVTVTASGIWPFVWTVGEPGCQSSDTVVITFHSPADTLWVDAGTDQNIDGVISTNLSGSASANTTTQWTVIQGSGSIEDAFAPQTGVTGLGIGDNVFVLTASFGPCGSVSDTIVITVEDLIIPDGFSPNGDGTNDHLVITGLGAFPDNEILVFNRWGQDVFSKKGYDNSWNGEARNGRPLPDDTYFYVLNLAGGRTYNGYLIIKR